MRQWKGSRLVHVHLALTVLLLLTLAACSGNRKASTIPRAGLPVERGVASWYGTKFHGRRTASGERYDMHELTAAHPSLPFGTRVAVRNTRTGREVVVRINDRGPFSKNRIIDLSYEAAKKIDVVGPGTARVELYRVSALGMPPRFTVQVGAFSESERANLFQQEMIRLYPETVIDSDETWYRVQIGAFDDRDHAESLRRELAAIGVPAVVIAAR